MKTILAALLALACGTQPLSSRVGWNEALPKVVNLVQPVYPEPARKAGIEGMVMVQVVVGVTGTVLEGSILKSSGSDFLDQAALAAAKGSTFEPGTRDGKPVEMKVTVPFQFRLDNGPKDRRGQAPGGRFRIGLPGGQVCRVGQDPAVAQKEV